MASRDEKDSGMEGAIAAATAPRPGWRGIVIVFALAALALWLVFRGAAWHAEEVSLPRYCDAPAAHLAALGRLLDEAPLGERKRRPYVVAAKLLYLIPRREGEAAAAYLARVEARIGETCR